ncbi:hypothetical protein ACS0TY_001713 [Phlomoides rotata]
MPIQYRIIRCRKEGEVRFTIGGAEIFLSVMISKVVDSGDIAAVKIKGSKMQWLPMGEESGANLAYKCGFEESTIFV